jgi:hypothetical protein
MHDSLNMNTSKHVPSPKAMPAESSFCNSALKALPAGAQVQPTLQPKLQPQLQAILQPTRQLTM